MPLYFLLLHSVQSENCYNVRQYRSTFMEELRSPAPPFELQTTFVFLRFSATTEVNYERNIVPFERCKYSPDGWNRTWFSWQKLPMSNIWNLKLLSEWVDFLNRENDMFTPSSEASRPLVWIMWTTLSNGSFWSHFISSTHCQQTDAQYSSS